MSVSAYTFGRFHLNMQKNLINDLSSASTTIKCALLGSGYTPNQNRHDCFSASDWQASTSYSEGDYVILTTANGHIYKCTTGGASNSSEPSWPTTDEETVTDNEITWECVANGDISYYEISGTGYSAGGQEISSKTLSQADGVTSFDGADMSWPSGTFTARYAVVYDDTPVNNEDKKLLGYVDFGEDKPVSGGDFDITWDSTGILTTTATQVT